MPCLSSNRGYTTHLRKDGQKFRSPSLLATLGVLGGTEALAVGLRTGVLAAEELASTRKSPGDHGAIAGRSQLRTMQPLGEDGTNVPMVASLVARQTGGRMRSALDRLCSDPRVRR